MNYNLDEIISCEFYGEDETYDLEVEHDDHTFFANDISVSNSHAISYSIISYQCAYLFTKHPYEWLSSFLDKETDDKKEAAISLVKSLGYSIEPVSIQNSDEFWTYDDGKFIQPFTSIKGLGEKAIEQIYLARPFSSIEDLLFNEKMTYSKFNKRALDVLIRSDALKDLMDERFTGTKHFWKAVAEDRPKTVKALKDNIEKYKDEGEFSLEEKIEFGVTLTGMYPMNLILTDKKHKALKSCDVNQISDYDYENPFSWFVIISKQEKVTAKGKKYSILTVTDLTNQQYQIKCWHGTDGLLPHNVYISKLDYEENWGFSTRTENNYRKI